jgi:hypothetical protein
MNRFHETLQEGTSPAGGAAGDGGRIEKTTISMARQLLKEGVPLQCLDPSTMEVQYHPLSL